MLICTGFHKIYRMIRVIVRSHFTYGNTDAGFFTYTTNLFSSSYICVHRGATATRKFNDDMCIPIACLPKDCTGGTAARKCVIEYSYISNIFL